MNTFRAALLSLLFLLVASAPAQAGWLGQQKLGRGSYLGGGDVALAGDAHGDALVAWTAPDGLRVALARPGARFGSSRLIPGSEGAAGPAVAVDSQGDAVVAWTYVDGFYVPPADAREGPCCSRVRAVILHAGRPVGATQTLTPRGTDSVLDAVAVTHAHAGIVYDATPVDPVNGPSGLTSRQIGLRLAAPPGRFRTPARTIAAGYVGGRTLALGPSAATVVYATPSVEAFFPLSLVAAKLDYGHGRATTRQVGQFQLGLPFDLGDSLLLADDAHGGQTGIFEQGPIREPQELQVATRSAGGRFAVRPLDVVPTGGFVGPALAVAPSGLGLVTWTRGLTSAVRVALVAVGHQPRDVGILHPLKPATETYSAADAVNSRGQAAIVLDAEGVNRASGVRAVLRSARGGYSAARDLDSPDVVLAQPLVTIDAHGRGVVVWEPGASVRAERFRTG